MAADGETSVCCVRCREPLGSDSGSPGAVSSSEKAEAAAGSTLILLGAVKQPPGDQHDWELAQTLRHVEHVLKRTATKQSEAGDGERAMRRVDAAHQGVGRWNAKPGAPAIVPATPVRASSERAKPRTSPLAWNLILAGLAAFSCGISLLIGSELSGRADLWRLGMPITFAGQLGLVLGMIFALEHVWRSHRDLSQRLDVARREPGDHAGARVTSARTFSNS